MTAHELWFASTLALAACGTATFVVQQYDGGPLPNERIAVLRINGGTNVVVVALDGEELSYSNADGDTRVHIEMLPGKHAIDVGKRDDPLKRVVGVELDAEAGRVYRLTIDALEEGALLRNWNALAWEVDRESDRALRVAPKRPPATGPAPPPTIPAGQATRPTATALPAPMSSLGAPTPSALATQSQTEPAPPAASPPSPSAGAP